MRPACRRSAEGVRPAATRPGAADVVRHRVPQPEVAAAGLDAPVPDGRSAQVGGAGRRDAVQRQHPGGRVRAVDLVRGGDAGRLGVGAVVRCDHAHGVVALSGEARPGEGVRPADVVGRHRRVVHELGRAAERGAVPVVAGPLADRDRDARDARLRVRGRAAEAVRRAAGVPRSVVVVPAGSREGQDGGVRRRRVLRDRDRLADVSRARRGDDRRAPSGEAVVDPRGERAGRVVDRDALRTAGARGTRRRERAVGGDRADADAERVRGNGRKRDRRGVGGGACRADGPGVVDPRPRSDRRSAGRADADVELVRPRTVSVRGRRALPERRDLHLRASGARARQDGSPEPARVGDRGGVVFDPDVREQEVAFAHGGRNRRRQRRRARAVLDSGAGRAIRDRVDHVRNRELGVVEVEGEQLRLALVDEPPPCARRRDVLAVRVEDLGRAEQHVRDATRPLVDEADPTGIEQACSRRPVERPRPRPSTLTALNRQVLLEAFLLEGDRLRTERGRAVRAVFVAAPRPGAGGGERDGRELGGETEARVRHVRGQTRCRLADEWGRRLWRAQHVP